MKNVRRAGVVLSAAIALSAIAASGAQAESAPFFSINGTRLAAGQTHNLVAKAAAPFVVGAVEAGVKLECKRIEVEKGVLSGSAAGEPGKGGGVLKATGCKLVEGNGLPNCELANPKGEATEELVLNPVTVEEVENVVEGRGGKQLLVEFFPTSGSEFQKVHFTGTGCTTKETAQSGQIAAEILTDPGEAKIELGGTPTSAPSWLLKFPTTRIKEVWLVTAGTGKIAKTTLVSFGDTTTVTGTALGNLATRGFVAEETKWSPLP